MGDREDINQSPCVRKCCLNEDDVCIGCFRTLEEIIHWSEAGDDEHRAILKNARERKAAWLLKAGDYFSSGQ